MKKTLLIAGMLTATATFGTSLSVNAQYYEIANQLPGLIRPALTGSTNYKGFVEAGYTRTLGSKSADFLEFSTSQGFMYSNWFYMGVGIGVDVLFAHQNDNWGNGWNMDQPSFDYNHSSTQTAAMLPLFTDFRFMLGGLRNVAFFIDLKVGCSFLLGDEYIRIGDGYLTNRQYFYLHPSLGLRIPTNPQNSKQAFDIGISYKLLTSNYWSFHKSNTTLNGLGVSLAYEW